MSWIYDLIRKSDILGTEASLYYDKSDTTVKSLYGGLLSTLLIMLMFFGGGYFSLQFFNRSNFTLVSNQAKDFHVRYENFNLSPFMIRLSGQRAVIFPDSFYNIELRVYYFDEKVSAEQHYEIVPMTKCDINLSIFDNSRDSFKNISEFDSYYCPDWDRIFDMYGLYGSTYFSFIKIYFSPCKLGSKNNDKICSDSSEVEAALETSYVDFITLTNELDHYKQNPLSKIIYKSRIPTSITVFKRIFLYFYKLVYSNDEGYIFESLNNQVVFNVKDYYVDIDLRNQEDNVFVWFTMQNYEYTTTHTRSYMKAQTLLANIGGIVKGLTLIGFILNYLINKNLYNLNLANCIYDEESFVKMQKNLGIHHSFNNSNLSKIKSNKMIPNITDNNLKSYIRNSQCEALSDKSIRLKAN